MNVTLHMAEGKAIVLGYCRIIVPVSKVIIFFILK